MSPFPVPSVGNAIFYAQPWEVYTLIVAVAAWRWGFKSSNFSISFLLKVITYLATDD